MAEPGSVQFEPRGLTVKVFFWPLCGNYRSICKKPADEMPLADHRHENAKVIRQLSSLANVKDVVGVIMKAVFERGHHISRAVSD